MLQAVKLKEEIQELESTMKMFEKILGKKLDEIFKKHSSAYFYPFEMEGFSSRCFME